MSYQNYLSIKQRIFKIDLLKFRSESRNNIIDLNPNQPNQSKKRMSWMRSRSSTKGGAKLALGVLGRTQKNLPAGSPVKPVASGRGVPGAIKAFGP